MLLSYYFLKENYGLNWDELEHDFVKENCKFNWNADELVHALTMAGLEIDGIERLGEALSGVVIAEVVSVEAHPNADKLRIAMVNTGSETLQIVCGAPNVAAGIKVPLAQMGAVLPNGLKIKKSALRGVDSFGMLCSAKELGLAEESEGLWILPASAPLGMDIKAYLCLPDAVLDVNVTPNRADCFSWRGLARDIMVIGRKRFPDAVLAPLPVLEIAIDEALPAPQVEIQEGAACPIYHLRRIRNINNHGETPAFIRLALERAGMKTHSPVVDITNYVMLHWGTPLHAFDAAKLSGTIAVRWAREGEEIQLLNEQKALLNSDTLVIADAQGAQAVAGVMGGLHSATQAETTEILLESAWFEPTVIAGKARQLNLSSDSAQRFERGVDYQLQKQALDWATALILEVCGGSASVVVEQRSAAHQPQRQCIDLKWKSIPKRLGRDYPQEEVCAIFQALGCTLEALPDGVRVLPPSWRFDLNLDVDLIEEIARIEGYHQIENRLQSFAYQKAVPTDARRRVSDALCAWGFNEALCYSFISPEWQQAFAPQNEALHLQNPISTQLSVMRSSLLPSLLQALQYNRHRQLNDVRLFEVGRVFHDLETQPYHVAGMVSGLAQPEQWSGARAYDFYDMKAIVEALLQPLQARFCPSTEAYLHPHQSADVYLGAEKIGVLGALHPSLLQKLGVKGGAVYAFELQLAALPQQHLMQYEALPRYPSVRRDLAVLVDKNIPVEALLDCARDSIGAIWQRGFCFDIYQHEKLGEKQSVALAFILQAHDRTLQDEEIDATVSRLIKDLSQKFKAELR